MIIVKLLTSLWLAFFLSTTLAVFANLIFTDKNGYEKIKAIFPSLVFAFLFPVLFWSKKGRNKIDEMLNKIFE